MKEMESWKGFAEEIEVYVQKIMYTNILFRLPYQSRSIPE
jgi:hypothetical protein